MKNIRSVFVFLVVSLVSALLSACVTNGSYSTDEDGYQRQENRYTPPPNYEERVPQHIAQSGKTVLVDPNVHAWGAYEDGSLIRAGLATAGSDWCPDLGRPCHTHIGQFHVYSLGSPDCKSHIFPIPRGGAPMPYCMFFSSGQALHGSPEGEVIEGNISHGCVRMHVTDAEWLRYNFVNVGTRVIVKPY